MWSIKKKKDCFQKLIDELITLLNENQVQPVSYFHAPFFLDYLTYYPYNHIYYFFNRTPIDRLLTKKEREFAAFIRKLYMIRKKRINLLLDSPKEYEYESPSPIGKQINQLYEKEINLYRKRLKDFEKTKEEISKKRKNLFSHPFAVVYKYVCDEWEATKCIRCLGTGIIPSIYRKPGLMCFDCLGTGRNNYRPLVSAEQLRQSNEFKNLLNKIKEPNFSCFPRKYKSIYIRVIHGGQIFLIEKLA